MSFLAKLPVAGAGLLKDHPTVKQTAMLEDASSTSAITATLSWTRSSAQARLSSPPTRPAESAGAVEFDPLYVDVIMRRYEAVTAACGAVVAEERSYLICSAIGSLLLLL
jgi:hypothetical protein